ncbi:MAG: hypothetical protein JW939_05540 [Candidatus Thermoplasmatota archaeon]|nr:hypothetical protein [Candidatus Thermoplasmatota archaeon]
MTSYQEIISELSTDLVIYRKRSDRLMMRVPDDRASYYDFHERWERKFRKVESFIEALEKREMDFDKANRKYFEMRILFEELNHQMNRVDKAISRFEKRDLQ